MIDSVPAADGQRLLSLSPNVARNLATTTKTVPQMRAITPRWLPRMLEWVCVNAGTYRVNRRLTYPIGAGQISFVSVGTQVRIVPQTLCELPPLRGFDDEAALTALADRFEQREIANGQVIAEAEHPIDEVLVVIRGKVTRTGVGAYANPTVLGVLAEGDHIGAQALTDPGSIWDSTATAVTPSTVLALPASELRRLVEQNPALAYHIEHYRRRSIPPQNKHGEAGIELASGHEGEADLPGTYVAYDTTPREYSMSVTQTVLRVHRRVADLYNDPMNQVEQQLRLTIEAVREREEYELLNNQDFGLLHNVDRRQRLQTRGGPPTPNDLDELLTRRRKTRFFLAHPRTISAFGKECTARGVYPQPVDIDGARVQAWRRVPMLPCDKIPISETNTTAILAMRTGLDDEGVIGLRPATLPDEYEPGLNVRSMGTDEKALMSFLVSAYSSIAVLVPDALGVLEDVELGR